MPSTSIPRSQTGLVPTSHQLRMDRIASPNNYRRLPPRPPPETFRYRGDCIVQSRPNVKTGKATMRRRTKASTKEARTRTVQKERSTISGKAGNGAKASTKANTKANTKTIKGNTQKKKGESSKNNTTVHTHTAREELWDSYHASEKQLHQLSPKQKHERRKSQTASLTYIRKSARHRTQLEELERRLNFEIGAEDKILRGEDTCNFTCSSTKNDKMQGKTLSSSENPSGSNKSSSIIVDLRNFKDSILRNYIYKDEDTGNDDDNRVSSLSTAVNPSLVQNKKSMNPIDEDCTDECSESLSLQSEERSLYSIRNSRPVPSNSLRDALSIQSNDSSLSEINSSQNNTTSPSTFSGSNTSTIRTSSSGAEVSSIGMDSEISNKSLWDDLSDEQMQRIRRRMKELCSSGKINQPCANINTNISTSISTSTSTSTSTSISNQHKLSTIPSEYSSERKGRHGENCISGNSPDSNESNEAEMARNKHIEDSIKRNACVSNIVSKISDDLLASVRTSVETLRPRQLDSNTTIGSVSSVQEEDIPRPISKPLHPFALPLRNDVRKSIKLGKK